MQFYNPLSNLPDDWDNGDDDFTEAAAAYHFGKAREAIDLIKQLDPLLAKAVADAVMHGILAANVYNHDMFKRSDPVPGESLETMARKNR